MNRSRWNLEQQQQQQEQDHRLQRLAWREGLRFLPPNYLRNTSRNALSQEVQYRVKQ